MKQLKYINSRGEEIDFRQFKTQVFKAGFHTYAWGYEGTAQQFGETIDRFTKTALEYEIIVAVRGSQQEKEKALNRITEVTEYDLISSTQGTLYWGDYYLRCNIISADTQPSENFFGAERTMGILAPRPFWVKELTREFFPDSNPLADSDPDGDLDYPYDYLYDYAPAAGGSAVWQTGHYAPSNFEITVYGPCVSPRILIADHVYEVYETLETGEYMVISNTNNKNLIKKYRNNGTIGNLYDMRNKKESIFEPIPGGNVTVNWSGGFGFTIKLFQERSEPAW